MGRLQVTLTLELTHEIAPVLEDIPFVPVTIEFKESGNAVSIQPPQIGRLAGIQGRREPRKLVLIVERECSDEQGNDINNA